ncbi:DUF563 domain [Micractinium conductrix]|uniref:DUF563 domain n=1 Tax=Micractinium conductrix TaxID=554055 RepID=A0A2P6VKZ9_9CHLO|nr:DUF563 domain [Micractinium conductrix]|eukprot:PSC74740.1 DUF563 domain [Micractinium conductrix]
MAPSSGRSPAASPRVSRAQRPPVVPLLLALLLGAGLLALHQRKQTQAAADAAASFAPRGINLQPLGRPPPRKPAALPLSSHKCKPMDNVNHRVCEFSNLVLHGGSVYYLTDDADLELPLVDTTYHPAADEKWAPTVLARSKAGFLLRGQEGAAGTEWASIPLAWLWKVTKRWDNLAHHFGEEAVTLHNSLCQTLGECSYPPKQEVQFIMLDSRNRGALLAPVNATLARCATGYPAVYRDDARFEGKAVVLGRALAGIGSQCHAQRGCAADSEFGAERQDKRDAVPPAALQTWRERLGACLGLDVHTPAPLSPKTVLIVDRPYEAGRHLLNIRSVEKFVMERFPQDAVRVQYFEDVPFPDQLRIINSVSILVMVHGSAIALWPFLPPGAVAVHIGPDVQTGRTLQRVWAEHYARDWGFTGLSFIPLNNSDPARQHMRWEKVMPQDGYKNLTMEEKLALVERGECPKRLDQVCSFHWKRQELSLVLDLDHLGWALDAAEADLRRKLRQPGGPFRLQA